MIDIPVLWACWHASLLHYVHAFAIRRKCIEYSEVAAHLKKRTKLLVFNSSLEHLEKPVVC